MSSRLVLNLRSLRSDSDDHHATSVLSSFGVRPSYHHSYADNALSFGGRETRSHTSVRFINAQKKRPSGLKMVGTSPGGPGHRKSTLSPRVIEEASPHQDIYYSGSERNSYELYELGTNSVRVQVEVDVEVEQSDSMDEKVFPAGVAS